MRRPSGARIQRLGNRVPRHVELDSTAPRALGQRRWLGDKEADLRPVHCGWNGAPGERYNTRMGLKDGENLNVTCPCCQAKLVIDPIFGSVLSHEAHVKPGPDVDLTQAHSILEQQKKSREDKFADSFFQETHKEDILAKKFEEAMKKAKDAPAGKPIRDFDLD